MTFTKIRISPFAASFMASILVLSGASVAADRGGEVGNRGNGESEIGSALSSILAHAKVITNGTDLDYRCNITISGNDKSWELSNVSNYVGVTEINTPKKTESSSGAKYVFKNPPYPSASAVSQCLSTSIAFAVPTEKDVKNFPKSRDGKVIDICWSINNGIFDNEEGKTHEGFVQIGLVPREIDSNGNVVLSRGYQTITEFPGTSVSGAKESEAFAHNFKVRVGCKYANEDELKRHQAQFREKSSRQVEKAQKPSSSGTASQAAPADQDASAPAAAK